MAQQGNTRPSRLQWALIITAVLAMVFSGATTFLPKMFTVKGEDLSLLGVIAAGVSALLALALLFTVATKRFKA